MELESSLVASQNALVINPTPRDPQQQVQQREQQAQRQDTELPRQQVVVRQNNAQAFAQAEQFRQQQQQTVYEQPDPRARAAISAYQSLATEQKRSEVQQLFGVDTYA